MIDRDRVIEILDNADGGGAALDALEEAGYRVVRAGMVPQLDALDDRSDVDGAR